MPHSTTKFGGMWFSPPSGQVHVQVAREAAHGTVRVTDRGAGIDPAYLPHVFAAFTPADIAHHTAGLNVSLAIAQQITHAHHGTIEVASALGMGTTFTVRLPQAPAWSHEAMPPGSTVPGPMDDEEHRREAVQSPAIPAHAAVGTHGGRDPGPDHVSAGFDGRRLRGTGAAFTPDAAGIQAQSS
jgi:hypothetical protein